MDQNLQTKTPEQMVEAIFALDLDPIKIKMMDKKEGHGWTRVQADHYELEYRRFLALLAKFPDEVIAPNTNVDKFWHGHILDTMKYAEDCDTVFGYFLHHFPYFGMRGEEDEADLANAAVNMLRLYEQEFGDASKADASYCAKASASYCAAASSKEADKAEAAYCAATSNSYCAAAVEHAAARNDNAAYCAATGASYCAAPAYRATAKPEQATGYCASVLAKGRPKLKPSSVC